MGLFLRLKKFLKKSEPEQPEEVMLSDLREWLGFRSQELRVNAGLEGELQKYIQALKDKRWFLECQLDQWQEKAREHAHVEAVVPLLRETRRLLDLLTFPDNILLEKILLQNSYLEQRLQALSEKIEASSFGQDFDFLHNGGADQGNLNPLLQSLLDIDAQRKAFEQKITRSGYNTILLVRAKLGFLEQSQQQLASWEGDLAAKKHRLLAADEKKLEKEKELSLLKERAKGLGLESLTQKQEHLIHSLEENETEILSFFSKIKPLLQQYNKLDLSNKTIWSYLEDPFAAFLQDERLSIRQVLDHIKSLLKAGKLSLNPEQFLISLTLLEATNGIALEQLRVKRLQFQQELRQITEQVQHNDVIIKLEDAAYRLDHFAKQVEKINRDLFALEEKMEQLGEKVSQEQASIQNQVKESLKRSIVLKV
ncbi:MAG TPA: hypothetical protein VJA18_04345 [Candidatus Nanoarchaeia archaeon]|nr:hypothetical protein [Candidatus Nanoarchaeia archaeon]